MFSNTFLRTLYEKRKGLVWWGISLFLLVFYMCYMIPTVITESVDFNEILEAWPEDLKAMLIGAEVDMGTAEGFLNAELFNMFIPILLMVYAIGFGGKSIAGEEEDGTLDVLLSTPVPRWRIVAEKFGAMLVGVCALSLVMFLGFALGISMYDVDLDLSKIGAAITNTALLGLSFGAIAFMLGAVTGKPGLAGGLAAGLGAVTFIVNGLAKIMDYLEPFQYLSPFHYQTDADPLRNGLTWDNAGVLALLVAVMFIVSLIGFRKRDVAV